MNTRPSADVHALTGAYVLDALAEQERVAFEQHLVECETCTVEVAEFRETAARLAVASATQPPAHLRDAVLARIAEVRQEPPETGATVLPHPRSGASRWPLRVMTAAAAALLVVSTTLAVLLVQDRQALDDSRLQARTMATILRAEDTEISTDSDGDTRMTVVSSREADLLLVLADDLPPAPQGHDYQAWAIGDDVRSAGLLVPHDGRASLAVRGIGTAEQLGITVEPLGGSDQPTTEPIMLFEL